MSRTAVVLGALAARLRAAPAAEEATAEAVAAYFYQLFRIQNGIDKDAFLTAGQHDGLELNDLVKAIEEKFGVSAAPWLPSCWRRRAAAVAEEKTDFNVAARGWAQKKVQVIKAVQS
jgi:hypothetical protein